MQPKFNRIKIPADKIIAWVNAHFTVKPRKQGAELRINSPFDDDTGYKFNINPERGVCHDWRSNSWAGPVNPKTNKRNCSFINFVQKYKKCDYKTALKEIMGAAVDLRLMLRPENRVSETERIVEVALPEGTEPLFSANDAQALILKKWLKSRGYTDDSIQSADIHYLGVEAYWPYYEFNALVYWQSRSRLNKRFKFPDAVIYDNNRKPIAKTAGTKGDFLYGFDDIEPASYLIITEAIFGKHTLGAQCVASGGASLTLRQVEKIKALGPRRGIILSPDNDKAGIDSIIRNEQLLKSLGYPIYYSAPPKLEYVDRDGTKKLTKDFNELFEFCGLSCDEIRQIHDKRIKSLTALELMQLNAKVA